MKIEPVTKTVKVRTSVTRTTTLELDEEQVAQALREHFDMPGAEVHLDAGSYDFFRGATLRLTEVTEAAEDED